MQTLKVPQRILVLLFPVMFTSTLRKPDGREVRGVEHDQGRHFELPDNKAQSRKGGDSEEHNVSSYLQLFKWNRQEAETTLYSHTIC